MFACSTPMANPIHLIWLFSIIIPIFGTAGYFLIKTLKQCCARLHKF